MMNEMEIKITDSFMEWAMITFKGIENINRKEMIQQYWNEQGYEITNGSSLGALDIIEQMYS